MMMPLRNWRGGGRRTNYAADIERAGEARYARVVSYLGNTAFAGLVAV